MDKPAVIFWMLMGVVLATGRAWALGPSTDGDARSDGEEAKPEIAGKGPAVKDRVEPFRRPIAGSAVYWNHMFSAVSLDKSHDLTHNPVYAMMFGLAPMWALTKSLTLSTDIGFETELTDNDWSTEKGEIHFKDVALKLRYKQRIPINNEAAFHAGLYFGAGIPTSEMSRFLTLRTAIGIGTRAAFVFPRVLKGMTLVYRPRFIKNFHDLEVPIYEGHPLDESIIPHSEKMLSPHYQALLYGSGENVSWSVVNGFIWSLRMTRRVSFSFVYTNIYSYKYSAANNTAVDPEDCESQLEGCDPVLDAGYDEQGIYTHQFVYNLRYDLPRPVEMFSLSVGAVTASNQLGPDGEYREPFFNRTTMITWGLSLDIDATISSARDEKYEFDYDQKMEQQEN